MLQVLADLLRDNPPLFRVLVCPGDGGGDAASASSDIGGGVSAVTPAACAPYVELRPGYLGVLTQAEEASSQRGQLDAPSPPPPSQHRQGQGQELVVRVVPVADIAEAPGLPRDPRLRLCASGADGGGRGDCTVLPTAAAAVGGGPSPWVDTLPTAAAAATATHCDVAWPANGGESGSCLALEEGEACAGCGPSSEDINELSSEEWDAYVSCTHTSPKALRMYERTLACWMQALAGCATEFTCPTIAHHCPMPSTLVKAYGGVYGAYHALLHNQLFGRLDRLGGASFKVYLQPGHASIVRERIHSYPPAVAGALDARPPGPPHNPSLSPERTRPPPSARKRDAYRPPPRAPLWIVKRGAGQETSPRGSWRTRSVVGGGGVRVGRRRIGGGQGGRIKIQIQVRVPPMWPHSSAVSARGPWQ